MRRGRFEFDGAGLAELKISKASMVRGVRSFILACHLGYVGIEGEDNVKEISRNLKMG